MSQKFFVILLFLYLCGLGAATVSLFTEEISLISTVGIGIGLVVFGVLISKATKKSNKSILPGWAEFKGVPSYEGVIKNNKNKKVMGAEVNYGFKEPVVMFSPALGESKYFNAVMHHELRHVKQMKGWVARLIHFIYREKGLFVAFLSVYSASLFFSKGFLWGFLTLISLGIFAFLLYISLWEMELEADEYSAKMGYGEELIEFLETDFDPDEEKIGFSHPGTLARIRNLKKYIEEQLE